MQRTRWAVPIRRASRATAMVAAGAALLLPLAAEAGAQELRYSLTPLAQRVQWDDNLGLENSWLYGGRVGFLFGDWVELQGFYMQNADNIETRFGDVGLPGPEGQIDISNYGADLIVNLGPWRLRPFLKAGGSVLRFDPQVGDDTRQIALRAGGGVRFGEPGQLRVQLYAEDLAFRINRNRLNPGENGEIPDDPTSDDLLHNLVYGAGISIPLGGAAGSDDTPRFGIGGLSLPVELYAGVLNFDGDDDLDGQNLAGVRTGLDFGRYVGLRGYYWRGVNDDFDDTQPIQSWGGEAQFNLNPGPGFAPYLVAGAGQLDFRSGFENQQGEILDEDRTVLILGGGVSLRLTDRLRLNGSARNYLSNVNADLTDATRTDDLSGSWLFSAGLGFNIGGSGFRSAPAPRAPQVARATDTTEIVDTTRVTDTVFVNPNTGERVSAPEGRRRLAARGTRTDTVYVDQRTGSRLTAAQLMAMRDTVFLDAETGERVAAGEVDLEPRTTTRTDFVSGQTTTIPVPTQGEIYIRYGPTTDSVAPRQQRQEQQAQAMPRMAPGMMQGMMPGAREPLSPAELREAIRSVIRDEMYRQNMYMEQAPVPQARMAPPTGQQRMVPPTTQAAPGAAVRPMDLSAMEERIMARVDELMQAYAQTRADSLRVVTPPGAPVIKDATPGVTPLTEMERERRMLEAIERIVAEQVRREVERMDMQRPAPAQPVAPAEPAQPAQPAAAAPAAAPPPQQFQPQAWSAYTGATISEGPQFILGARLNVGSFIQGLPALRLVPEVAFGFGSGATSTLLAGNAQYWFPRLDVSQLGILQPYAGLGLGLLNFSDEVEGRDGFDIVFNPALGAAWSLGGAGSPLNAAQVFAEYQGVAFFDLSRLNVGLRWDWGQ